jgi:hypothetical protein
MTAMAGETKIIDQVLDIWHRADKALSLIRECRAKAEEAHYEADSLFSEVDALLDTLQRKADPQLATHGDKLVALARDLADWSERTFGPDTLRGPIGALKHLEKEAREAQAQPGDIKEYADILILWLDASRRAGFTPLDMIDAAIAKMQENKARTWPAIDLSKLDEPTEHIREGGDERCE